MSIHVICPSCAVATEFHRAPVSECAKCQTPFPAAVRESSEAALLRATTPQPVLLMIGQWVSLVGVLIILAVLASAPFDVGTYTVDGVAVSGPQFLRRGGWIFALEAITLLAVSVGLLRRREWARFMMIVFWIVNAVSTFAFSERGPGDMLAGIAMIALTAGIAGWYLYRKPNVRAYFEMLERIDRDRAV